MIGVRNSFVVVNPLLDTAKRRALSAELAGLRESINNPHFTDSLSESLRVWVTNFTRATRVELLDTEAVQREYISLLKELLTDSITGAQLEKTSFLGSDGNVYGKKSLSIFLVTTPPVYPCHFPNDPLREGDFVVEPHALVTACVEWLLSKGENLDSTRLDQDYQAIVDPARPPTIPTLQNRERRRVIAIQQERDHRQAVINERIAQAAENARLAMIEDFQRVRTRAQELIDREDQALIREEQALVGAAVIINRRLEELDRDIQILERDEKALNQVLDRTDEQINELDRANAELKRGISETNKAIKKRKKQQYKQVAIAVGCLAGSMFGTWLLSYYGFSASVSATATPGELMARVTWAI